MEQMNFIQMHLIVILPDPPVVRVFPAKYTVNETGEVKLNCFYVSNPATLNRTTWFVLQSIVFERYSIKKCRLTNFNPVGIKMVNG